MRVKATARLAVVNVNPSTQGTRIRAVMEPLEMLWEGNMMGCGEWVEQSRFWHPGIWPRPLPPIAMINLYCDESFDVATYALAGWIASPETWDRLVPDWQKMLKNNKAGSFHAADIVGRDQIKDSPFKGWSFKQEVKIFSEAADILTNEQAFPDLQYIGFSIAFPDPKNVENQDVIWFLLFARLFLFLANMESLNDGISFMFDNKEETRKHVNDFFYKAQKIINAALPERIAGVTVAFGSDQEQLPLQAADFFAYEWRKRISDKVLHPEKAVRKSYARLRQRQGHLEHFSRDVFEAMLAAMDEGTALFDAIASQPASEE